LPNFADPRLVNAPKLGPEVLLLSAKIPEMPDVLYVAKCNCQVNAHMIGLSYSYRIMGTEQRVQASDLISLGSDRLAGWELKSNRVYLYVMTSKSSLHEVQKNIPCGIEVVDFEDEFKKCKATSYYNNISNLRNLIIYTFSTEFRNLSRLEVVNFLPNFIKLERDLGRTLDFNFNIRAQLKIIANDFAIVLQSTGFLYIISTALQTNNAPPYRVELGQIETVCGISPNLDRLFVGADSSKLQIYKLKFIAKTPDEITRAQYSSSFNHRNKKLKFISVILLSE
jgi:hypothetical protein